MPSVIIMTIQFFIPFLTLDNKFNQIFLDYMCRQTQSMRKWRQNKHKHYKSLLIYFIVMLLTNTQGCFIGGECKNTICVTSEVQSDDLGGAILLLMSFLRSFFYSNWRETDSDQKLTFFKIPLTCLNEQCKHFMVQIYMVLISNYTSTSYNELFQVRGNA